jgi:hypothetical protein
MPSYIEIDKQATFPSASNAAKVIFGINSDGFPVTVNENGSVVPSGGVLTVSNSNISSSTLQLDLKPSSLYKIELQGDGEIQLNNPTEGGQYIFILKQLVGGENITWPVNVVWVDNYELKLPALESIVDSSFNVSELPAGAA